jgi:guanylate kinase
MKPTTSQPKGTLFVISAPSGAGKTSLANALISSMPNVARSISHTTRNKRPGEKEGEHYYFVEKLEFQNMLARGDFLEHAEIFDHLYGTCHKQISQRLADGIDLLLTIDWQGARQVCALFQDAVSIFLLPPSMAVLQQRLDQRNQDEAKVIEKRLQGMSAEVSHYPEFQYLVVNDVFEEALYDLQTIIRATRLRQAFQSAKHAALLVDLLNTR